MCWQATVNSTLSHILHGLLDPYRRTDRCHNAYRYTFLSTSADLQKVIISFVCLLVYPSVHLCGITELTPSWFSCHLTFGYFSLICQKNSKFYWILTRTAGTVHGDQCTIMIIYRAVLLRTRNVLDRSCRENQNTYFMLNNFFPQIMTLTL
jgi:hypothetical protein